MSYDMATLLRRNLHEVFGEGDDARRRAAVDEIFADDVVFFEPNGIVRGKVDIHRLAGAIRSSHPDFVYSVINADVLHEQVGRIQWVSGKPGEPPQYAGTDILVADEGKIVKIYLFFDKIPEAPAS